ncbi:Predicted dehydrogenase [Kushneria avicenniae]|uniref:Predicted dehydrogenase n=1 Tax=Kushneria avicenniae TaxID=402385 RepID=A0A1I1MJC5_9GAMM|nr:oxidoreductase [Kushneria avicenniae]SFC85497.1 Predicted dehydrogenase [Kushneria avicenniae]
MYSPLNTVIIGFGLVGRVFHAPLIRHTDGLTLRGVVSSRPDDVHADLPDIKVYPEAEQALKDPEVDLIVIATPNDTHAELALAALEAGKHVVIDKPATLDRAELERIIDTARRVKRMVSVFQNRRWDADFLTLKGLLDAGRLGHPTRSHLHFDRFRPEVRDRWRERPGPGSGGWYDLGSHLADQALTLFGTPRGVYADLATLRPGGGAVDYFHVLLRYDHHRVVLSSHALSAHDSLRYAIDGTRASYIKHGIDTQEQTLRDGGTPGQPGWGEDPVRGTLYHGETGDSESIDNAQGEYRAYYANIVAHLHGDADLAVTPEQALDVMRVIDAAHESSATGREVEF